MLDMIDVSDRTRSGCSIAAVWAIMPPIEAPTRWALSSSSASSRPSVSAAMSDSVYDAELASPRIAARRSGCGAPVMWLDRPASRLSNRITCVPWAASASQNPSGQPSIWVPRPMMSSAGGDSGRPNRSYAMSTPEGPTPWATSTLSSGRPARPC